MHGSGSLTVPAPVSLSLERGFILIAALALDRLGEPPTRWHPVGWIGKLIAALTRCAPSSPVTQLWYGVAIATLPAALAGVVMYQLDRIARLAPWPLRILIRGAALSWTFSLAGLERAARDVAIDLDSAGINAARQSLRSLVSRPTTSLSADEIAAAAVESLAENASDSVIAPLFWWSVAGPAAAAVYRAINTADSMVGYHGRYEMLGRASARLDDAVNLIPARLTGLALCAASLSPRSLNTMLCEHGRTESPNAGWPMSAMAGALHRRLTKPGHYVLADQALPAAPRDIERAISIVRRATALMAPLLCLEIRRTP
jgi:adenosylcobinamide-phosphate synthase